ncbi:PIN domain-containing protein [Salegentibacter maritimus]|uniref:PIN domain-containing protein n=1 Tax=Salegentibacter maritimus TaxID=2794347 RepID=UPI0018E48F46|nr:hypothetical protein [Salegentibacter maritimus]MBI6117255.1 hypothetical protein [Salegentibacter maritimus]
MEKILIFIAEQIFSFGITTGFDKIFGNNKEYFKEELFKTISSSVEIFKKRNPIVESKGNIPFYKSKILFEEFLKFRIFDGYQLDSIKIQNELEKNPRILKPSEEELSLFFQIFNEQISSNAKLKHLEIEEFHKEKVYEIHKKVNEILSILNTQLIEIVPLLENHYRNDIEECIESIKNLKPQSALKRLQSLGKRLEENSNHISNTIKSKLFYLQAVCYESLQNVEKAYELFLKSYNFNCNNKDSERKVCIYHYLNNCDDYLSLLERLNKQEPFNEELWVIKVFRSEEPQTFLKNSVPEIVKNKNRFKRLIFNLNLAKFKNLSNEFLFQYLKIDQISKELPDHIYYNNFYHWKFIFECRLLDFFQITKIQFQGNIDKTEKVIHLLDLSKILYNSLRNSEIKKVHKLIIFNHYWLQSEIDLNEETLNNLLSSYNELPVKDALRTLLIANSFQKNNREQEALKIIGSYPGELDESLITLKLFCNPQRTPNKEDFIYYLSTITVINELNISNICNFLIIIRRPDYKNELRSEILKKQISEPHFERLLNLILKFEDTSSKEILEVAFLFENYEELEFIFGFLLLENNYPEKCVDYLEDKVSVSNESRELLLFIRALEECKTDKQLELLRLLKLWREKDFSFKQDLINLEISLLKILKDYNTLFEVATYGLKFMPESEYYFSIKTFSSLNIGAFNDKPEFIDELINFNYKNIDYALLLVDALYREEYFETARELLYKLACDRNNSNARMKFITLKILHDDNGQNESIKENSYVKYQIDNSQETIHINERTLENPIVSKSIGKSVGDSFHIESQFSPKLKNVQILEILDKYSALQKEIYEDMNSSFSGLPVEVLKFDSTDIKSFEKTFIVNFGHREEERRNTQNENLNQFKNYQISFFELAYFNYDKSFFDSYYLLTSNQSEGFYIKPLKYLSRQLKFENKNLVVDFTSAILFFELSKEHPESISFLENSFVISSNFIGLIDNLIIQTKNNTDSPLSVSIYTDKVIPHFYGEDFNQKRISFLESFKDWLIEKAQIETPTERLKIDRSLYAEGKISFPLEFFIDCGLLGERDNYLLISDDIGYSKLLGMRNFSTTEFFLIHKFPEMKTEIINFFLKKKYVGVTINALVLYNSYIFKNREETTHVYNYALRNLTLKENFNQQNLLTTLEFLKMIALNPAISKEIYARESRNLFIILVPLLNESNYGQDFLSDIKQKFALMGSYLDITLNSLLDAFKIKYS